VEVLSDIQRDILLTIEQNYFEIPPELLATAVNDNHRMQEKCEELADKIRDLIPDNDEREGLITILEDVQTEFINTSAKAAHYLTR
jgi:NADH:ubiquinone oxidoreductase subunit E